MRATVVAVMMLAGCASATPDRFVRTGTAPPFEQARYACLQDSQQWKEGNTIAGPQARAVTNRSLYVACMSAKGYTLNEGGPHEAPATR